MTDIHDQAMDDNTANVFLIAVVVLAASVFLLLKYITTSVWNFISKIMEPVECFDFEEAFYRVMDNIIDGVVWAGTLRSLTPPPEISNLYDLLEYIHIKYIAVKKEEFQLYFKVFHEFFSELHRNMKQVDKYYQRYSKDIKYAGSHYDNLRINKPNEFDMDIVIGLPVNMDLDPHDINRSDIIIEPNYPGFVQLRAGVQYRNLTIRDKEDVNINKIAYSWLDDKNYILRSKFTNWFKSVGCRALNKFKHVGIFTSTPAFTVDGTRYLVKTTESGPAWTVKIIGPSGFRLDVDLVPAFKFPESRWPVGKMYRPIPRDCTRKYWLVVPKPNKHGNSVQDEHRSWRIALQDQERELILDTYHLRQAIRIIKKLRDSLGMNKIASYYIKTIFLWEIMDAESNYRDSWCRNRVENLFEYMLKKLYYALDNKNIPYFWNRDNNLIEHLDQSLINQYKYKIFELLRILENPDRYKEVAKYLLSPREYAEYCRPFYAKQLLCFINYFIRFFLWGLIYYITVLFLLKKRDQ